MPGGESIAIPQTVDHNAALARYLARDEGRDLERLQEPYFVPACSDGAYDVSPAEEYHAVSGRLALPYTPQTLQPALESLVSPGYIDVVAEVCGCGVGRGAPRKLTVIGDNLVIQVSTRASCMYCLLAQVVLCDTRVRAGAGRQQSPCQPASPGPAARGCRAEAGA